MYFLEKVDTNKMLKINQNWSQMFTKKTEAMPQFLNWMAFVVVVKKEGQFVSHFD